MKIVCFKRKIWNNKSFQVPVNQEILSRSRKSGSTGIDTEVNELDSLSHQKVCS